jgi:hypothetical protein
VWAKSGYIGYTQTVAWENIEQCSVVVFMSKFDPQFSGTV